jgi:hypothetical protein
MTDRGYKQIGLPAPKRTTAQFELLPDGGEGA